MTVSRLLAGATAICWLSGLSDSTRPACRNDPEHAQELRAWVLSWTSAPGTDTMRVNRRVWPHLPSADSTMVTVVADSLTCEQARSGYAQSVGMAPDTISIVAVRADSVYVVIDPACTAGEWILASVLGSRFQPLKGFLY